MAAEAPAATGADAVKSGSQLILLTLAAGQFVMTLDSSVMNVSIAQVANDVGTTVTGIQTAITMYTLVMAALMITGAKIGAMIGLASKERVQEMEAEVSAAQTEVHDIKAEMDAMNSRE